MLVCALGLFFGASPAAALASATVSLVGTTMTYTPTSNGADTINSITNDTITAAGLTPGAGCTAGTGDVTCPGATAIAISTGQGDDYVQFDPSESLPVTVDLGSGDDTLYAYDPTGNPYVDPLASGDMTVSGGLGWDAISTGTGSDTVSGGPGNDSIWGAGTAGGDVLSGDSGDDYITGRGDTVVDGGAGNDMLVVDRAGEAIGGPGDDTMYSEYDGSLGTSGATYDGGDGNDFMYGSGGDDSISGGPGDDVIWSGAGNDRLNGGDGNDVLDGGAGSDSIVGGPGDDRLRGSSGWDSLDGGTGSDTIRGGADSDSVTYQTRTAAITVTLDNKANDGAAGEADNVRSDVENITGGGGDDTLTGNDASNYLDGGDGVNKLVGGGGDDMLQGGEDADTLDGGPGNDWLMPGDGATDKITGGTGNDSVDYGDSGVAVNVSLDGKANDGGPGENDAIAADVENIQGSWGYGDTLTGNAGPNRIDGGGGADFLYGGMGNDILLPGYDYDPDTVNGGLPTGVVGTFGVDRVSYDDIWNYSIGVSISLTSNQATVGGGPANTDTLVGIRDAEGGPGADWIEGGPGVNHIWGDNGDDTIYVWDNPPSADVVDCGSGTGDQVIWGAGAAPGTADSFVFCEADAEGP